MKRNQIGHFPTISKKIGKYAGEWVGFAGKKLVAHDRDARVVYKKVRALYPGVQPYIFKVPDGRMYLL
jgi:hypothetical protein